MMLANCVVKIELNILTNQIAKAFFGMEAVRDT